MSMPAVQVGKLVRLLGSDRDGEVVAAARALGRTLAAAGFDWHDLAEVASRHLSPPMPSARPHWQELAQQCLRHGGYRLKPTELDFLSSMSKWPTEPSGRQLAWLDAIARGLDIERCAA